MISRDQCFKRILREIPEFKSHWDKHNNEWHMEDAGLCMDFAAFSWFAWEQIIQKQTDVLARIFELVEKLMREGEEEVKVAVSTCFLENILNRATDDVEASAIFLPLLGPESRGYCIAWDKFTGVRIKAS
jgi:hypothetical protein